ncbi:cytochrome p450, partial [Colletotrichum musicola]
MRGIPARATSPPRSTQRARYEAMWVPSSTSPLTRMQLELGIPSIATLDGGGSIFPPFIASIMALSDVASALAAYLTPTNLLAAAVLYYIISSIMTWHRLRHFPGPPLARFSYLWMISNSYTGRPAETYTRL